MNKKPNIILITVDCLRADHLGFLGYEKDISPNLDKLAKESTVFTQAFTTSSSTPYSFPAILTSTYPLDYQGPQKIEKPRVLISEVLKGEGYITAAIHSNPFLSNFFGYNQGWDFFEDITLATGKLRKKNALRDFFNESFKNITFSFFPQLFFKIKYLKYKTKEAKIGLKVKATLINQIVKDFIQSVKNEEKPFFLWVHYMDVHGPYFSRENYYFNKPYSYSEAIAGSYINYLIDYSQKKALRKFLEKYSQETINLYDQGVKCLDTELGKLLNFLNKENLFQNTIICLTSDHGEELFEHQEKGGGIANFITNYYKCPF
jgi:arylsulfatase A-like enzyme